MGCVKTTTYESVEQALLTTEVEWNLIEKIKEVRKRKIFLKMSQQKEQEYLILLLVKLNLDIKQDWIH